MTELIKKHQSDSEKLESSVKKSIVTKKITINVPKELKDTIVVEINYV